MVSFNIVVGDIFVTPIIKQNVGCDVIHMFMRTLIAVILHCGIVGPGKTYSLSCNRKPSNFPGAAE